MLESGGNRSPALEADVAFFRIAAQKHGNFERAEALEMIIDHRKPPCCLLRSAKLEFCV